VIGLLEPEICTKTLKEMNEKLRAKFPATTPSCSMVKIGRLDDSFFGHFLTPSNPSRRPITAAKRKPNLANLAEILSQNVLKRDSSGKNG